MNINEILNSIKIPKITTEDIKHIQEEVKKSPEIIKLDEEIKQLKEIKRIIEAVF